MKVIKVSVAVVAGALYGLALTDLALWLSGSGEGSSFLFWLAGSPILALAWLVTLGQPGDLLSAFLSFLGPSVCWAVLAPLALVVRKRGPRRALAVVLALSYAGAVVRLWLEVRSGWKLSYETWFATNDVAFTVAYAATFLVGQVTVWWLLCRNRATQVVAQSGRAI